MLLFQSLSIFNYLHYMRENAHKLIVLFEFAWHLDLIVLLSYVIFSPDIFYLTLSNLGFYLSLQVCVMAPCVQSI